MHEQRELQTFTDQDEMDFINPIVDECLIGQDDDGNDMTYMPVSLSPDKKMTTSKVSTAVVPDDGQTIAIVQAFESDPFVIKATYPGVGTEFGLVLVAGWPPDLTLLGPSYHRFLTLVRSCFDETDIVHPQDKDALPAAYLYPPKHLHVTVAMCHRYTNGLGLENEDDDDSSTITRVDQENQRIEFWKQVIHKASQRTGWPTAPFRLRLDRAQIGSKAGILVWEETTGGMAAMRQCISDQVAELKSMPSSDLFSTYYYETLAIPNIVHSTFLRFSQIPKTNATTVQSRFQQMVLPQLSSLFPDELEVDTCTLVCARTPYMHIPYDEHHVMDVYNLGHKNMES
eukprot:scaffold39179_cov50-Attheya_sp.AAC.8